MWEQEKQAVIGKVREASGGVKKLNLLWENFRNLRKFKENEHIGSYSGVNWVRRRVEM